MRRFSCPVIMFAGQTLNQTDKANRPESVYDRLWCAFPSPFVRLQPKHRRTKGEGYATNTRMMSGFVRVQVRFVVYWYLFTVKSLLLYVVYN
jgi:hypothetical protein